MPPRKKLFARTPKTVKDNKEKNDLREAMVEDISRGRRPVRSESKRSQKKRIDQMRLMLSLATEEEFVKAMRDAGVESGSPRFLQALQIWRAYRP